MNSTMVRKTPRSSHSPQYASWLRTLVAKMARYLSSVAAAPPGCRNVANGAGWRTDYPWGERHLLLRLSEITKTRVSWVAKDIPHSWLVRLTDPALFQCSYVMASDVGTIELSPAEAAGLRQYLEKGGFLWVDDGCPRADRKSVV